MRYIIDIYKKGVGTIKDLGTVDSLSKVKETIDNYCKENNVHIVAKEYFGDAHWNYLNDGTEIDYCSISEDK